MCLPQYVHYWCGNCTISEQGLDVEVIQSIAANEAVVEQVVDCALI